MTYETARVCVDALRTRKPHTRENPEPQDGGGSDGFSHRLFSRFDRLRTTTNYTLGLDCSSSRRESNIKVILFGGGSRA